MWNSGDISIPTAQIIAAEIRRKKRLAMHVMSLRSSRVAPEVLDKSDLELALARHAHHPGIGQAIQALLMRFFNISRGKEDYVNMRFERCGGSPFQAPPRIRRHRKKRPVVKITTTKRAEKKRKDSLDGEERNSDDSDTVSESESEESEYSDTDDELEEEWEISAGPEEPEEEEKEPDQTVPLREEKPVALAPTSVPLKEAPVPTILPTKTLPLKEEKGKKRRSGEGQTVSAKKSRQVEKALNKTVNSMVQKILNESAVRERKREQQDTVVGAVPKVEKEVVKKEEKQSSKAKKPNMKKGVDLFLVSTAVATGALKKRGEKKEKKREGERSQSEEEKAKELAKKLEALPLEPSRSAVQALLSGLGSQVLIAAEKLIGRPMRRVNRVWWELLLRDFGAIDPAQNSGDVRDIYAAKQLFAERKRLREQQAAKVVVPPTK